MFDEDPHVEISLGGVNAEMSGLGDVWGVDLVCRARDGFWRKLELRRGGDTGVAWGGGKAPGRGNGLGNAVR